MGLNSSESFGHLLRQARAGDRSAWGRLLEVNRSWLVRAAWRRFPWALTRKQDASDLVQDCLHAALGNRAGFRGQDERSFRGWLRGILVHMRGRALRHWGRRARDSGREQPLPGRSSDDALRDADRTSVAGQLARDEDLTRLNRALERLLEEDRRLIQLRFFEDVPFDVIAARCGRNPATLRKQLPRALEKLRRGMSLLAMMERRHLVPLQREALCLWHFRALGPVAIAAQLHLPR